MRFCSRAIPVVLLLASLAWGAERQRTFAATDTLNPPRDSSPDAEQMLAGLRYAPQKFAVTCWTEANQESDGFVSFPSPRPCGIAAVDRVVMEWYAARDAQGQVADAPAVLIVHELDYHFRASRVIASMLAKRGVHAFVMHLPGFGRRESMDLPLLPKTFVQRGQQGVADARRARDAIAALPHVASKHICIQGTSLGGFVTASAAAIDGAFDRAFVFLAGGGIEKTLAESTGEAKLVWPLINGQGIVRSDLGKGLMQPIEPLRIAHRLPAERTWLISAAGDGLVTPACANALASAAKLAEDHHLWLAGNHLTCMLLLPQVVDVIAGQLIRE